VVERSQFAAPSRFPDAFVDEEAADDLIADTDFGTLTDEPDEPDEGAACTTAPAAPPAPVTRPAPAAPPRGSGGEARPARRRFPCCRYFSLLTLLSSIGGSAHDTTDQTNVAVPETPFVSVAVTVTV
jgi:hypothetical protein